MDIRQPSQLEHQVTNTVTDWDIAIHEAGHAVVAGALGGWVGKVSIDRAVAKEMGRPDADGVADFWPGPPIITPNSFTWQTVKTFCYMVMAGMYANEQLGVETDDAIQGGAESDLEIYNHIFETHRGDEYDYEWMEILETTKKLVAAFWDRILVVAEALVERRTLNGHEVLFFGLQPDPQRRD